MHYSSLVWSYLPLLTGHVLLPYNVPLCTQAEYSLHFDPEDKPQTKGNKGTKSLKLLNPLLIVVIKFNTVNTSIHQYIHHIYIHIYCHYIHYIYINQLRLLIIKTDNLNILVHLYIYNFVLLYKYITSNILCPLF